MRVKRDRDRRLFTVWKMKWVYLVGLMVIIGGVMAFGLLGFFVFHFDRTSALSMIAMVPLMILVYTAALNLMLSGMEKRMKRLIDGIHEVSGGNLSYRIEMKNAEEYRILYQEFNQMAEELSATRAEMEAFTNEFAHEFKTPIASINGFSELLLENSKDIDDEERLQYLKMIRDQSKRLLRLSQNTLLLSKVNAMQIVTGRARYDLGEQIRRCVILFHKEIEEKKLTVNLPEEFDPVITGNEELLEHVWLNLLSNAIKYTKEDGEIAITFRETPDRVSVSITDTGIGMDEETVSHIFEKYYQHDTVSITRGNGIGLSIVGRIVELSEGSVSVSSYPGTGTTFTVELFK